MNDFNYINFNGLNKALVIMLANFLKIEIDQEELDKEISRFQITKGAKEHWAHPSISDGRLYVRHGDVLMVYDVKGK